MPSRDYREMSDHELLSGIMKKSVLAERHRRIAMYAVLVMAAAVVIALLIVLPRVLSLINEAELTLNQANHLLARIQPAADSFSKIDFDGLRSSINTLQDTITELSRVMSIFGR